LRPEDLFEENDTKNEERQYNHNRQLDSKGMIRMRSNEKRTTNEVELEFKIKYKRLFA